MIARAVRPLAFLAIFATTVFAIAACGAKVTDIEFEDTPADKLYNEGLVLMNAGDFRTASLKFEEVDRLHPYTDLGRKSQVMIAFANYSRGQYDEAVNASRRFLALYPSSPDAAYAQYIIANSYYKRIPDVTRDQADTDKALAAYQELVDKWPESEYADDARRKVVSAQDQLAGKEMEVGRYYLERHDNLAAINRFRVVVEKYQQTRQVEEALFRLVESYYALGIVQEAQTAAAVLGHNFPESRWYQDAFSLLSSGGFAPAENRASWISRAFGSFKIL